MPPVRRSQNEAHEIHRGKGLESISFYEQGIRRKLDKDGPTVVHLSPEIIAEVNDLTPFHPSFEEEHPGSSQELPTSLPLPSTSREELRLDGYFK
ncbi:hypothetical protein TNCV_3272331 [Trichonephila clavipes]|nr:hypothetical protein TNCV_3272331 [Trichonephila clavipes]